MQTLRAIVIRTQGPEYIVDTDAGDAIHCVLSGRRLPDGKPVVGDHVHVEPTPGEAARGVIVAADPRVTVLRRAGFRGRGKVLVANIDRLIVTVSAQSPPLRPGLIDRYIVAAEKQRILPVLCFNKWELAQDEDREIHDAYHALGYPCLQTSAENDEGIDALHAELIGHRSAFVGHSGVGKSSLMRRVFPHTDLAVGVVNAHTGRGRHTTTHARLLPLEGGGHVVDTPGVREFGLVEIESDEVAGFYVDFAPFSPRCRFTPCTHTHEPDCAVKDAVEQGEIHPMRFDNYTRLYAELEAQEASRYR